MLQYIVRLPKTKKMAISTEEKSDNTRISRPVRINMPKYDNADKETSEKTLDEKAREQREYQARHPFLYNVAKNVKQISEGWDDFWENNLFRYPAMVAGGAIIGKGIQQLGRIKKAADLIRLRKETAHLKQPYRDAVRAQGLEIHDRIVGDALDAYGKFQQTPLGMLLPFDRGKGSMSSFVSRMGPLIYRGLKARNVSNIDNAYDYMMRQIALESTYGDQKHSALHNYGGIMKNGKLKQFKSDQEFVDYYLNLMNSKYSNALSAKDLTEYANQLKKGGYYPIAPQEYFNKLNGLKTYSGIVQNDLAKNRKLYEWTTGIQTNPETGQAQFVQPIPVQQQPIQVPMIKHQDLGTFIVPIQPNVELPQFLDSNGKQITFN